MRDNFALAYVFGLGMVAVFNPCGFAMLPAWIAYFLAADDDTDEQPSVGRAVAVGATLTAGFVSVFLVIGLVLQLTAANLVARLPWLSIVLGVAMVGLAVSLLLGRDINVGLPWAPRGPRTRTFRAVFVFGVSYAFVSLACTIPLFLAAVTTSMTSGSLGVGILNLVAYALGMGVIITALTVALSLARASFVRRLRRIVPHVRRIAATLLAVAGGYVAYYGWYSLQVYDGNLDAGGPAKTAYGFSARMTQIVIDTGPIRIGAIALGAIAFAFIASNVRQAIPRAAGTHPAPEDRAGGDHSITLHEAGDDLDTPLHAEDEAARSADAGHGAHHDPLASDTGR
jgi:cytochrome c biogenesis protein CcdA